MKALKRSIIIFMTIVLFFSVIPVTVEAKGNYADVIYVGQTYNLKAKTKWKGATKWNSNNKKVATVSKKGVISAKATGTVTITGKDVNGKKNYKFKVLAKEKGFYVEGNQTEYSTTVGDVIAVSLVCNIGGGSLRPSIETGNVTIEWGDWNDNQVYLYIRPDAEGISKVRIICDNFKYPIIVTIDAEEGTGWNSGNKYNLYNNINSIYNGMKYSYDLEQGRFESLSGYKNIAENYIDDVISLRDYAMTKDTLQLSKDKNLVEYLDSCIDALNSAITSTGASQAGFYISAALFDLSITKLYLLY